MISQQLNYIPVIINFRDGTKKITFLVEGCFDEDRDPYFTESIVSLKGMNIPKELDQYKSGLIESITQLKAEQENEI